MLPIGSKQSRALPERGAAILRTSACARIAIVFRKPRLDLIFLGTSSGVPTKSRNVTALALLEERGRGWMLIDCGEGTQHRLLHAPLSLNDLQAILITHVHGDHCYGLPGLLGTAGMSGRRAPLTIVAPQGIEAWFRATQRHTQLHLPFEVEFIAAETLAAWRQGAFAIDAIELEHRVPSYAYRFTEAHVEPTLDADRLKAEGIPQGPLWGRLRKGEDVEIDGRVLASRDYLRAGHRPRRIIVGGDNARPERLAAAAADAQLLVHEATYTSDIGAKAAEVGHSTAAAVAAFAEAAGLPNLLLTHFSPRYASVDDLAAEAARHYRGRLFLAEDLARYRLGRGGELARIDDSQGG